MSSPLSAAVVPYRGRFAPSPTGPLHFGSLVAALGSYLEARAQGGQWLVRIEDLDAPRVVPGAADDILRVLDALGLTWDGAVVYQSQRVEAYRAALFTLQRQQYVYACACTRKEIADSGLSGIEGYVYPGTCRDGLPAGRAARAWRLATQASGSVAFEDAVQGRIAQDIEHVVGDFVLLRADGLPAYQLAVVVDDAAQAVTEVVRGADLVDSTPRQIYLQRRLGLPTPRYAHLPVVVNAAGDKLSKQTLAAPISVAEAGDALARALAFLGQAPPDALYSASTATVLEWGRAHWRSAQIPRRRSAFAEG